MSIAVRIAIDTALGKVLPPEMNSIKARVLLLAIQKQEDPEELRYQRVRRGERTHPDNLVSERFAKGPARGLWQFEQAGGVRGVLGHEKTQEIASAVCSQFSVLLSTGACWRALEHNDVFAACFARLLLWTDSSKLPDIHDADSAFACYLRNWRPGAYERGDSEQRQALKTKFLKNHQDALYELGVV